MGAICNSSKNKNIKTQQKEKGKEEGNNDKDK